jgi:hypothetical protein
MGRLNMWTTYYHSILNLSFFDLKIVRLNYAKFNNLVGFEVFTAVTKKNAVFWDVNLL